MKFLKKPLQKNNSVILYSGLEAPIIAAIVQAVAAVASFVLSKIQEGKQKKKMKKARKAMDSGHGHLVNFRDTQEALPIIYGKMKVGGGQVYIHTTGSDNKYLHIIQTIGEGELDSLVSPYIYLDDKPISDFGSLVYYEFFNGSSTQNACSTLTGYSSEWTDPLRNTAYCYIRLEYNKDKFSAIPDITFLVKGRKVYDTRTSTTVWSDNPALCYYDLIRNTRYGAGIDSSFWDEATISSAANWCDVDVGGGQKRFVMNAVIKDPTTALDISQNILDCFRNEVFWTGSKFKLLPMQDDAPVMNLVEDDIKEASWVTELPSVQDFPNSLRLKYINEDNFYVIEDLILKDVSAINLDGEEREDEIFLHGISKKSYATRAGAYILDRRRLDRVHSFVASAKAMQLEPGDCIQIKHSVPNWVAYKKCRVKDVKIVSDAEVKLSVLEEATALYDDAVNVSTDTLYSTSLPDPLSVPPSVGGVNITEELYVIKDQSHVRMKVTWQQPAGYYFLDYVEVWLSHDAGATYYHYTDASGGFTIQPVKDGETWYIKLLSVNINGKKQSLSSVSPYTYTTTGVTTPPADVPSFSGSATNDTVQLRWTGVSMQDLAGYEIRYGSAWGSSIYFGFTKAEFYSLVGVKPSGTGVHNFSIKAKDTLNNYSTNAAVTSVKVILQPNLIEKHSVNYNFTTGNHYNTERFDSGGGAYVLRVKHDRLTNGNFETGTFSDWSNSVSGTGAATFTVDNVGPHGGTYHAKTVITNAGSATTDVQLFTTDNKHTVNGKSVTVRFWAKASAGRTMEVAINSTAGGLLASAQSVTLTTDYQLFTLIFTPNADKTDVSLRFRMGNQGTNTIYIDDVELENLHGKYIAPAYEMVGGPYNRRHWSEFTTVINATGATWTGGIGNVQWNQALSTSETWIQQFANVQAGVVKMRLFHDPGVTEPALGSYAGTIEDFQIIAAEVNARWIRCQIEVDDNDKDSFIYINDTFALKGYWTS